VSSQPSVFSASVKVRDPLTKAQKLFMSDERARSTLTTNLKSLILASKRSDEEIARITKCPANIVSAARNGTQIGFPDAEVLARHFNITPLTLLCEDVTRRVAR
jgi:hypothetical protein